MADAEDLKSSGDFSSCGFDSHPGHHSFRSPAVYPGMYLPHGKYDWVPSPRAWQICLQDGWAKRVHAIAVEENAAVLVEADGHAKIVGFGPAYFLEAAARPKICADGEL